MKVKKSLGETLLRKFYKEDSISFNYLYPHSKSVAELALKIANNNLDKNPDLDFIYEAAMLHDIGIYMCKARNIGCYGNYPYIAHGSLGRQLMIKEGYPEIGLVCERHVGVGISLEDIRKNSLPIPERDMMPVSLEEKIICYADKFYSKDQKKPDKPKSIEKILTKLSRHSPEKPEIFKGFMDEFGYDYII